MEDYTPKVGRACVILLIALIVLSYVPPFDICGVEFQRIEFLSNILPQHPPTPTIDIEDTKAKRIAEDDNSVKRVAHDNDTVLIEDFDTTKNSQLSRVRALLRDSTQFVRMAFMGDSFVEGDIMTADLREELQSAYGGGGVGFVPFSYKQNNIRPTIKIISKGWQCYSILERDKLPESISKAFSYAGWITLPEGDGASTTWRTTKVRDHINEVSDVRILFISTNNSSLRVECNDAPPKRYQIKGSNKLQQITISQSGIRSIKLTVDSGADGFIGYGAHFESGAHSGGVSLDNLPIRSNNGSAMFAASRSINNQISNFSGAYDIIFLQYGLNVIQPTINGYTRYGDLLRQMIRHIKSMYPRAAVVVVGVSDRCRVDGEVIKPMRETAGLERFQREAARCEGVAFWSMRDAMLQHGGMQEFVSKGWASKDYTHVTFSGGSIIASELARALKEAKSNNPNSQDNGE